MSDSRNQPMALATLLASHPVWRQLGARSLESLAAQFSMQSVKADRLLLAQGELPSRLGLIIGGEVRLDDPDLGQAVLLSAGQMFGFGVTPRRQLPTWQARTALNCELAWLQPEELQRLCEKFPALLYFFPSVEVQGEASLQARAYGGDSGGLHLLSTPIKSLIKRPPISLPPQTSIQTTAQLMSSLHVSSVLLVEEERLLGLVTDRDLRNRAVAQGLDISRPVSDIATMKPMTVSASSPAFEALLLMARHDIHHVPVTDGGVLAGMITTTDLAEQQSTSAIYLTGNIYKQATLEGLQAISARVKSLQKHLADADASAYSTGHIVTAITDALTTRLIQLAELQLGPAPVKFVWIAAGSQARNEQTAKSDQDNCLILDDSFDPAQHGDYFREFASYVCDGLAACGYVHCPGQMMAMTDTWRQPRKVWVEYFRQWIHSPKPKALMLTCVFFDLRAIHGEAALLDSLRTEVLVHTKGNSLFLAHMVSNALKHRPPLGMFGTISLIKGGKNPGTIDLKHGGIVPIVDLARIYALAAGVSIANTHDRLELCAQAGEVSAQSARDLRDALEFLAKLRIAHQARQIQRDQSPDNFLALQELSNFERNHLKNAFGVVQTLQGVLQQRYSGGQF